MKLVLTRSSVEVLPRHQFAWFVGIALICPAVGSSEDVRFKRLSGLKDAQQDAKHIAKYIQCDICQEISRRIAGFMKTANVKREEDVLEEVGSMCGGKYNQDSLDFILEKEGFSIAETKKRDKFVLVKRDGEAIDRDAAAGGEVLFDFAHRDSMKQACMLTVDEYQSELSEFLFMRLKKKKIIDKDTIVKKLCFELSRACGKKQNPKLEQADL